MVKYISEKADQRLVRWLEDRGYEIRLVSSSDVVSQPVDCHPDMFMCRMGCSDGDTVVLHREFDTVESSPPHIRFRGDSGTGSDRLMPGYPGEISYNAACTGRYLIHNLRYTAPEITEYAARCGIQTVNVKQGYAKCSTVIVDDNSVITYDMGIGMACRAAGMDVLMVGPGHVRLPGYDTGFIGGASGRAGDVIVFNGDLMAHPDAARIIDFARERGLDVKWFSDWPLEDIGSII